MTLTFGQAAELASALPALALALDDIAAGKGASSGYEALGQDALTAIAAAVPSVALWIALGELAFAAAPFLAAIGDPNPMADAQLHLGRGGRG